MTTRQPDWRTINTKLVRIRDRLDTLIALGDVEPGWWDDREVEALAVERIIIIVVDLAVDINNHVSSVELGRVADDYKESFLLAARAGMITRELAQAVAPSAGTRNVQVAGWAQNRSGGR